MATVAFASGGSIRLLTAERTSLSSTNRSSFNNKFCIRPRPKRPRSLGIYCQAVGTPSTSGAGANSSDGVESGKGSVLVRFTRPHTMRGTLLGALSGVLRAIFTYGAEITRVEMLVGRAFMGLLALLFGNAYIVGLNQIYDVKIDKINKPFLPIASGELAPRRAWILVVISGIAGLAIVNTFFSPLIFGLYVFGMTIASLYSIPPFRLKRFPILAALTISCVRGFLMNFGVYHATIDALGIPFAWNPAIVFLAGFMSVFACIIAISKDLPDISGDVAAGIPTFASRKGTSFVVKLVGGLLAANYAAAISVATFSLVTGANLFNAWIMIVGHTILAVFLGYHLKYKVDPNNKMSIKRFYAFIWQLFYAEYVLFPFI